MRPLVFQRSGSPMEVTVIRERAAVNVTVRHPETEAGRDELARRAAEVHASAVVQRLRSLNCPERQKLELLDAVIAAVKMQSREQT